MREMLQIKIEKETNKIETQTEVNWEAFYFSQKHMNDVLLLLIYIYIFSVTVVVVIFI